MDELINKDAVAPDVPPDTAARGDAVSTNACSLARGAATDAGSLVGTVLDGKYRLRQLIGRGGFSAVYQAVHEETEHVVAIKLLFPHFWDDAYKMRRFKDESRTLSTLEHPNIGRAYAFGVTPDGRVYLVLEYLRGRMLRDLIPETGMPTDEVIYVFKQIAAAVAYAHDRNVLHCDLKPDNVIVLDDATDVTNATDATNATNATDPSSSRTFAKDVKVLDFGIAKLLTGDGEQLQRLTATGVALGTATYMSPEQLASSQPDVRSDIYSFGCILYQALVGHPPFNSESPVELLSAHLTKPPPPIPIPASDSKRQALSKIAMKCLAKNKEDRVQNMPIVRDLFDDVEVHGDCDVELVPTSGSGSKSSTSFGLDMRIVGLILLLITVAVFVANMIASTTVPPPAQSGGLNRSGDNF